LNVVSDLPTTAITSVLLLSGDPYPLKSVKEEEASRGGRNRSERQKEERCRGGVETPKRIRKGVGKIGAADDPREFPSEKAEGDCEDAKNSTDYKEAT